MHRTITIVTAVLLSISPTVYAEDPTDPLLNLGPESYQWGFKQQHMLRVDMNMPPDEYAAISSHNQKVVKKALRSYSNDVLELVGIPERGARLIGAAVGLATRGAKLNLNSSKTLTLEFKDVDDARRSLYFGVSLDW